MIQKTPLVTVCIFLTITSIAFAQKEIIKTDKAPGAIGPYSQGVKVGSTLYVAGQIALAPETGKLVEGGIVEQTKQCIKNIEAILNEAGFNLNDVVQCQIFLSDLNNYAEMNTVYADFFKKDFPARAVIEAARIPRDALIEIMVTAQKQN